MLAYVFWHEPLPGADTDAYEESLGRFQEALRADRPGGLTDAFVFRHLSLPWSSVEAAVYEDWYLVDGFASLGALNEAAVTGTRKSPHDDVAQKSGWGAGGVYRLLHGEATRATNFSYWMSKPDGWTYDGFLGVLRSTPFDAVWQRQMVLGPAPEFCVHAREQLELDLPEVLVSSPVLVWPKKEAIHD